MKKLVVIAGLCSVGVAYAEEAELYAQLHSAPQEITKERLTELRKLHPDILEWKGEGDTELLYDVIEAENRLLVIAILRDLMDNKVSFKGLPAQEAVDEILSKVTNKGMKNLIENRAKKNSRSGKNKKPQQLEANDPHLIFDNLGTLVKVVKGTAVLAILYGGWKVYRRLTRPAEP